MINLDPRNGAHIYPTHLAIDRHVITDKETEKSTVLWRLLEINNATQRYSIVCMSTSSAETAKALACHQLSLSHYFEDIDAITPAFDDLVKRCKSAISIISQHAAMEKVKHG